MQPELAGELVPHTAGWYAGAHPWDSIYGSPLRLAESARRFDVSPAWHSWVGQAPALELLTEVGGPAAPRARARPSNRFRAAVGAPPGDSAIVSLAAAPDIGTRLQHAGIAGSVRAGRLRLAFHINNDRDDVDTAANALAGHVQP